VALARCIRGVVLGRRLDDTGRAYFGSCDRDLRAVQVVAVLDCLPDARQRDGSRGCGAGGFPTLAGASGREILAPKSYLSTIVTRLSIDRLRSAKARREEYVGPWLPEPIATGEGSGVDGTLDETFSMAFLVLLESLTPVERAVFLLREVFDYDYAEIASLVGKSEDNCRQISRRASPWRPGAPASRAHPSRRRASWAASSKPA
jgi:hypothetical protein